MAFYLRYTRTPEKDINRGTSVHMIGYGEMKKKEVAEMFDLSPDELTKVAGQWAQVLDGICGFDLYVDTIEEAIEAAEEHNFSSVYNFKDMGNMAVIFEGEYCGDCPEGDLFNPSKIVHKF